MFKSDKSGGMAAAATSAGSSANGRGDDNVYPVNLTIANMIANPANMADSSATAGATTPSSTTHVIDLAKMHENIAKLRETIAKMQQQNNGVVADTSTQHLDNIAVANDDGGGGTGMEEEEEENIDVETTSHHDGDEENAEEEKPLINPFLLYYLKVFCNNNKEEKQTSCNVFFLM